jgi:hypothetical protein
LAIDTFNGICIKHIQIPRHEALTYDKNKSEGRKFTHETQLTDSPPVFALEVLKDRNIKETESLKGSSRILYSLVESDIQDPKFINLGKLVWPVPPPTLSLVRARHPPST